jgi:hypothetical protein
MPHLPAKRFLISNCFKTISHFIMSATSIPAFHVSDHSEAKGHGEVFIQTRTALGISGTFIVDSGPPLAAMHVRFDPPTDNYPIILAPLVIKVDLSDSVNGKFTATSIELINSYGKDNPTIYLTGRCNAETSGHVPKGCRYWLMIANNKKIDDPAGTPDIVGFAIHDSTGIRIAYGTGPLKSGDFYILPKAP